VRPGNLVPWLSCAATSMGSECGLHAPLHLCTQAGSIISVIVLAAFIYIFYLLIHWAIIWWVGLSAVSQARCRVHRCASYTHTSKGVTSCAIPFRRADTVFAAVLAYHIRCQE
jgi:hypothetical protein